MANEHKRLDGYIRVSRVNGREGEGFHSPEIQRSKIEQWAELHDVELGEIVEELEVSGVKALAERGLGRLIERCEQGESDGIVVYRVDRFSRSPRDTFEALERLEKAGARLVGVADGVDSSAASGELVLTVLAGIAREQWRQRRDNWAEVTGRAVADGVHISSRPPRGYKRENDERRSRLVLDPKVAPLIRECFIRRAKGESWQALATFLHEEGVPTSKNGVRGMLRNRAYLGEARGPNGVVNASAHEPLVTVNVFEAAQYEGRTYAKSGAPAEAMLSGLLTCAACGHKLGVLRSTHPKTGERIPNYFCKGHYASGKCPAPSAAQVRVVDQFVRDAFAVTLHDGTLATTMDAVERYSRAESAVAKAQRDFDELATPEMLAVYGAQRLTEMGAAQKEILREAKRALRETAKPGDAVVPDVDLFGEDWPVERQRQLARQFIAAVTLTRGGKGRWSAPIGQRLAITWAGADAPDATLGDRVERLREEVAVLDPILAA